MKKIAVSVLLAVVLITALISCSARGKTDEREVIPADTRAYDSNVYAPSEAEYGYFDGASNYMNKDYSEEFPLETGTVQEGNDLADRKIIRTGNIRFQTTSYDEMVYRLEAAVSEYSGYIQSSNQYGGGIYEYNTLRNCRYSVRIPADRYEEFMKNVCTLGTVTNRDESMDDITMTYIDMESRLSALEAEHKALVEMLEKSKEMYDVIALHDRLSDITYEIEGYKAQLRKYDDLISYCTVNIYIDEVKKVVVDEHKMTIGERMGEGLSGTMENIRTGLEEFSVDFVTNLPYIIIWVAVHLIIGIVVIIIVKSVKKKRKARAAAAGTSAAQQ